MGCDRLPRKSHGKEGVSGSSPEEGFPEKEGVDLLKAPSPANPSSQDLTAMLEAPGT